jgi:GNAT superfamily N-acetyltransferase
MSQFSDKTTNDLGIRLLSEGDIPAAMGLKELAGWNQSDSDWRRLLEAAPRGCFAACVGDRVVATTTAIAYGSTLAWIGMVLVDHEYRRLGIATALMRQALGYLHAREVRTVKLDATPAGRTVYARLGFVEETLIERWQGAAPCKSPTTGEVIGEVIKEEDVSRLLALDAKAFGADRSRLLQSLVADSCVQPLAVGAPDGKLCGYALAREGAKACYVGPLVATDKSAAASLLDRMLAQLGGREVFVDINISFAGAGQILAERGFVKQRDLVRMRSGQDVKAGTSPWVFAIAGPEIG